LPAWQEVVADLRGELLESERLRLAAEAENVTLHDKLITTKRLLAMKTRALKDEKQRAESASIIAHTEETQNLLAFVAPGDDAPNETYPPAAKEAPNEFGCHDFGDAFEMPPWGGDDDAPSQVRQYNPFWPLHKGQHEGGGVLDLQDELIAKLVD